jgi:hypothetical protein
MMNLTSTTSTVDRREPDATPPVREHAWVASLLALIVVAAVWTLCLRDPAAWRATGIGQSSMPFLDLYGSLAAGEVAHAHGNPYESNPLDPLHRPHLYTSWWLATGAIGLTRADTAWVGWTMLAACLLSAIVLVRPRRWHESLQVALVLCSPAVLMAVNRGNNDWFVFGLMSVALALLRLDASAGRIVGVALLAVAALLKYYPLAALVVLWSARSRRDAWFGLGVFTCVLLLGWPALQPGLEAAARFRPSPDGLYAFGAPNLFHQLGLHSAVYWIIPTAALGLWGCWLAAKRWSSDTTEPTADSREREFACGAALLITCFFLGATYAYKLIFAVWLLPWFWRDHGSGSEKRWRLATLALLLAVLWFEGISALAINVAIEPRSLPAAESTLTVVLVVAPLLSWALVICLFRWLVLYAIAHARNRWPDDAPAASHERAPV